MKNSFFRRLRSSSSDKAAENETVEFNTDTGSKSTGWKKRNATKNFLNFESAHKGQYGGNHLYLPFVLMG